MVDVVMVLMLGAVAAAREVVAAGGTIWAIIPLEDGYRDATSVRATFATAAWDALRAKWEAAYWGEPLHSFRDLGGVLPVLEGRPDRSCELGAMERAIDDGRWWFAFHCASIASRNGALTLGQIERCARVKAMAMAMDPSVAERTGRVLAEAARMKAEGLFPGV